MGWLIAAGILVLLAVLPLGVSAIYDAGGALAKLIVGPIRLTLYPAKSGKEKKKKPKKTEEKKKTETKKPASGKKKGGSLQDFLPVIDLLLDFLGTFRRKLRVNRLEMKLIMAADDPCDLAVNYGKAWAAVGSLMPQLERLFKIRKKDVDVACDFTADKTLIYARLDLTITLGRLLSMVCVYGIKVLRVFPKLTTKTKKGGVK